MPEYKRVVRDKNGKITGIEVGDPHAPSAEDFRSAYRELVDTQRGLDQAMVGDVSPGLEQSRQGIGRAAETIAELWHGVSDDTRYSLVRNFRESAKDMKRSTKNLATAIRKAETKANDEPTEGR
jgi:hypothetical protein